MTNCNYESPRPPTQSCRPISCSHPYQFLKFQRRAFSYFADSPIALLYAIQHLSSRAEGLSCMHYTKDAAKARPKIHPTHPVSPPSPPPPCTGSPDSPRHLNNRLPPIRVRCLATLPCCTFGIGFLVLGHYLSGPRTLISASLGHIRASLSTTEARELWHSIADSNADRHRFF